MKVLIVEDEILIALYIKDLVSDFGYETCAIAATPAKAMEQAARHRPDVALMDIRLAKGGSGIEAASGLHAEFGLRCIFLSANVDEETKIAVAPYRPLAFIDKPVLPVLLELALQKASDPT